MSAAPEDPRTDQELMADHVAGDTESFGILFARHRDRLWAVALRTLGNPEDAADGLQDALVAAWRRAGSYRGDAAVTTWLHRVVVNACLDRVRSEKVRAARPLPDDLDEPSAAGKVLVSGDEPPEDATLRSERREALLAALRTLPAEQRAALVLVDMEGMGVREAAEVLGCAEGTVKSRCARGRSRLAVLLAGLRETGTTPAPGNRPDPRAVPSPRSPRGPPPGPHTPD